MHFGQSENRKQTLMLACGTTLSALFLAGTMGIGTANAAADNAKPTKRVVEPNTPVLVSPDIGLAANQFQPPAFTPMGSSKSIITKSIDRGNWHYEIRYRYGDQGWEVAVFEATRIHPSQMPPVPRSTLFPSSLQANLIKPPIAGGNDGSPPNTDFPAPSGPGSSPGQKKTVDDPHYIYGNHCFHVQSTWTWISGHWEGTGSHRVYIPGHWAHTHFETTMISC